MLRQPDNRSDFDWVSVEEPLQIRVCSQRLPEQALTVTLRTPGADIDLAYGLLRSEGVITDLNQVLAAEHCGPAAPPHQSRNTLKVTLSTEIEFEVGQMARFAMASASCGFCGKTSLQSLHPDHPYRPAPHFQISSQILRQLPSRLRQHQEQFSHSGGLHAAALFSPSGEPLFCAEDIGRHNAVDKVLGGAWRRQLDYKHSILVLSGRAGYELIQKAIMADIGIVAAIGAPSSLAIDLANEFELTLVGFLNRDRFNIYSAEKRLED